MTHSRDKGSDKLTPEAYAGYGVKAAPRWLGNRTAEKQAAFFLPYLRSGMTLLDCGCGPGSITLGLAQAVSPGPTVGIDIDRSQIELAQRLAAEQGVSTVRFEAATIYQLPFPDHAFDAVFSHAVLGHLADAQLALQEIHRVVKPGGIVGIRNPDYDGYLLAPTHPVLMHFLKLHAGIIQQKGGNPYVGKTQPALLHQVGFGQLQTSATYECYGTPQAVQSWGSVLIQFLREESFVQQFRQLGVEQHELESMSQAWQAWMDDPTALFADAWVETIGWKAYD